MSGVNIGDAAMQQVIAAAVIGTLTPEKREELLEEAVVKLLTPETNQYGSRPTPSPLQQAFEIAVRQLAREVVVEKLKDDPDVRAKIEGLVMDGVKRATEERREEMVDKIANGIAAYLSFEK